MNDGHVVVLLQADATADPAAAPEVGIVPDPGPCPHLGMTAGPHLTADQIQLNLTANTRFRDTKIQVKRKRKGIVVHKRYLISIH